MILYGHRDDLLALAHSYGFHSVRVFGSCARGEDRSGSDVDLLVDGKNVSLFDISNFSQDAAELLLGVRVDVVVPGGAGPTMVRIIAEAVPL